MWKGSGTEGKLQNALILVIFQNALISVIFEVLTATIRL